VPFCFISYIFLHFIMKKFLSSIFVLSFVLLSGCASEKPLTEAEQAETYGITVEQFREEKKAAARMNMNIEAHMKMLEDENGM